MIGHITIICFASSYLTAFGLEITRMFFRSGVRGAAMLGFAGVGLLMHTLFLVNWWISEGQAPLSSEFDWCLVAAWILVVIYFILVFYHPRNPIGLFCLPLILGFIAVAWFWASQEPFPKAQGTRWWQVAHGGSLLLGTVAVTVGFVSGLMYLLQAYRLKHKLPPRRGFELPSLEWLSQVSERAIVFSVILLLCGFGSGLMLSKLAHNAVSWSDPVVWSSSLLAAWMAVVAVFNFAYKASRQGRKVAYLTIATFVFLVWTLASLLVGHDHERNVGGRFFETQTAATVVTLSQGGRP